MGSALNELKAVLQDRQSKPVLGFLFLSGIGILALTYCSRTSNSLALQAFLYLIVFDILSLLTCLITIWVSKQKPNTIYSFGYERVEVVAVFTSTILVIFFGLSVIKHGLERLFQPPIVYTADLLVATLVGITIHLLVTYCVKNKAYSHVAVSAASNWIQDAVSDIESCFLPFLSRVVVLKFNPLVLLSVASGIAIVVTNILIDYSNLHTADAASGLLIAALLCSTMTPLAIYSGRILLQTVPENSISHLDKLLRETLTLDGVLELRNEQFWTLSFGVLAGSLHVRVKRDANEQAVLAQITNKLAPYVSQLTVQVFKEDWSLPAVTSTPAHPHHLHPIHEHGQSHSHSHGHGHSHGKGHSHSDSKSGYQETPLFAPSLQTSSPQSSHIVPI
eukprot:m.306534 g.306534  ORF g.306534 m.306534 type:complete len:391 (+) comp41334_c0_seq1:1483-2655(+)